VCSPALLAGPVPLRTPADLASHTLLHIDYQRDQWEIWLTAAGLAPPLAQELARRGMTFDQVFMSVQAAADGLGVALAQRPYVAADIAAGRLVAPFDVMLPSDAGFYVVSPQATADAPEIAAFRGWAVAEAARGSA
jgi:LysR family glycine cleavage system transcriptional activator